jgi:hypothetical protein
MFTNYDSESFQEKNAQVLQHYDCFLKNALFGKFLNGKTLQSQLQDTKSICYDLEKHMYLFTTRYLKEKDFDWEKMNGFYYSVPNRHLSIGNDSQLYDNIHNTLYFEQVAEQIDFSSFRAFFSLDFINQLFEQEQMHKGPEQTTFTKVVEYSVFVLKNFLTAYLIRDNRFNTSIEVS